MTKTKSSIVTQGEPQPVDFPQDIPPLPVAADAPALTEITVSFKCTIPTQQYGNMEFFASQKIMAADTLSGRQNAITSGINEMKWAVAQVLIPLAEAEIERGHAALIRKANPDNWMQIKNPLYRWLRVAAPELVIPAMEAIILDPYRIDQYAE
jgi:hypothetical protein